ncbi:MAG: hypothetical protein HY074_15320 [Deltaproteobacteria bacterium]|nr:hypothetical protein [Deltaproteobacteria bacterium]
MKRVTIIAVLGSILALNLQPLTAAAEGTAGVLTPETCQVVSQILKTTMMDLEVSDLRKKLDFALSKLTLEERELMRELRKAGTGEKGALFQATYEQRLKLMNAFLERNGFQKETSYTTPSGSTYYPHAAYAQRDFQPALDKLRKDPFSNNSDVGYNKGSEDAYYAPLAKSVWGDEVLLIDIRNMTVQISRRHLSGDMTMDKNGRASPDGWWSQLFLTYDPARTTYTLADDLQGSFDYKLPQECKTSKLLKELTEVKSPVAESLDKKVPAPAAAEEACPSCAAVKTTAQVIQ